MITHKKIASGKLTNLMTTDAEVANRLQRFQRLTQEVGRNFASGKIIKLMTTVAKALQARGPHICCVQQIEKLNCEVLFHSQANRSFSW
ncbi:hypothetical protein CMV_022780 [Castanea mollissima]|uniref:Uncharacterized protein n=1 Tax=Castanea mollissima TaxID=60419 RepID=A0A8J4QLK7_9ROSI|nr:hypothetical protein CMV_022780 [Castanea mollissima]